MWSLCKAFKVPKRSQNAVSYVSLIIGVRMYVIYGNSGMKGDCHTDSVAITLHTRKETPYNYYWWTRNNNSYDQGPIPSSISETDSFHYSYYFQSRIFCLLTEHIYWENSSIIYHHKIIFNEGKCCDWLFLGLFTQMPLPLTTSLERIQVQNCPCYMGNFALGYMGHVKKALAVR